MLLHPLLATDLAATIIDDRLAHAARLREGSVGALSAPTPTVASPLAVVADPDGANTDLVGLLRRTGDLLVRAPAAPAHAERIEDVVNQLLAAVEATGRVVPPRVHHLDPPIVIARTLGRLAEAVAGGNLEIDKHRAKAIEAALFDQAAGEIVAATASHHRAA